MYRKYFFKSKGVLSRRFVASGLAAVFSGGMFGSYAGAMQQGLNIEFVFAENEHLKLDELLIKQDNDAKEVIKFVYKFYKRHYNQLPNQNPMWALLRGDVENGDNLLNNEYFLIRLYAYLLLYKFREFKGQINIKNFLGKCDDNKFREYFDSVRNFFRDDDDGGKKSKNLLKEIKNGWGRGLLEEVEKEKDLEDFIKENYKEGDYVNLVPDKEKILDMILSQEEMQKVRSSGSLEDFKDLIPEEKAIIRKIFDKFCKEQESDNVGAIKGKFLQFLSEKNIKEWIKNNLIDSFPELSNGLELQLKSIIEKKDVKNFIKGNYKEGDYVDLVPDKGKILDMILSKENMQKVRKSGSLEGFKKLIPEKKAIINKIFSKFCEEQECARAEAIKEKFLKFLSKENIEKWIKNNLINSFSELSKGLDLQLKSIIEKKGVKNFIKENYNEGDYVDLVPDKDKILGMILRKEDMQKALDSGSLEDFKDLIPEKEAIISKIFNKFYEEQECARAEAIKEKFLKFLSKENIEEWIKKNLISSFPELSKGLNDLRLKSINSNEKNIKKPLEDLEKTKSHKLRNTIIIVAAVAIIATVITAISLNLGKSKTNTGVPNNNNNNKDDEKVNPSIEPESDDQNPEQDNREEETSVVPSNILSDNQNTEQNNQEERPSVVPSNILKVAGATATAGTLAGGGTYLVNKVLKSGKPSEVKNSRNVDNKYMYLDSDGKEVIKTEEEQEEILERSALSNDTESTSDEEKNKD